MRFYNSIKIKNLKFKIKLKRFLTMLLILIVQFSSFSSLALPAFAQEVSTSSAEENALPNLSNPPSATDSANSNIPSLSFSEPIIDTPQLKITPPVFVQALAKVNYQAKEDVQVVVKNSANENLSINVEGENYTPNIVKTNANGDTIFTIYPSANLRPGRYKVKVLDTSSNTVISEQEFIWGVLAINTNKSIYAPNETAKIAMAVLDEAGNMVCTAKVALDITTPYGITTHLSTDNGDIKVNPDCRMHSFTVNPDYETSYQTSDIGRHTMTLTASTFDKGSYTTTDRFEVRSYVPFDIERDTATRIYPPDKYPVKLKITANEAFKGKIVESVPSDFQISQLQQDGVIGYTEESSVPDNLGVEKNYGIPHLGLPFNGSYPVTLGFGQEISDPKDKDVYKKTGLDGHDGIDFGLPEGTPVLAVDGGKVILAKENWIYGTSVVIEHAWGRAYYGHISKLEVVEGQTVSKGEEIALSGSTGLATGPHLHFGLKPKENDIYNLYFGKIDPAPFLGIASEDPVLSVSDYPISTKALVWNVDIEKGAQFAIGYQYKAPLKSPNFYTIGPLQFITSEVTPEKQAKFDPSIDSGQASFVLGSATESAVLISTSSADLNSQPQVSQSEKDHVVFAEIRPWQLAIDAVTSKVEQQINIIDQEYSMSSSSYVPTDNSLGLIHWDSAKYNGDTVYFEAVIRSVGGVNICSPVSVALFSSSGTQVTGSAVSSSSDGNYVRVRSNALTLDVLPDLESGVDYTVRAKCDGFSGGIANFKAARLIITQSDATAITDTQTQIEIGNNESTTSTSSGSLTAKKLYLYDHTKFSPAPTAYFEASIASTATGSTNTGAIDCGTGADAGAGNPSGSTITWSNPQNACATAGSNASAALNNTATTHYLKATNLGFSLPSTATINGIQVDVVRSETSNKGKHAIDSAARIIKSDGSIGTTDKSDPNTWATTTATYGGSADLWGETWTYSDINNSNFGFALSATANGNATPTAFVDTIKITVYYTDSASGTAYAALYTSGGTIVTGSEVTVSSTTWSRVRSSAITLTDGTEYVVRIKTSDGARSAKIANAKIIFDQTAAGGITALETVHEYNNTSTVGATTYASKSFPNSFNKANWSGGNFAAYFESTLKTNLASYFARLDTPLGEVTGTDTSYTRKRNAADLWSSLPGSATDIDVQLKNGTIEATTSSSNSWLIIQVSSLGSVESGPTNDQLMRHGKWFNSGVEQPFTF